MRVLVERDARREELGSIERGEVNVTIAILVSLAKAFRMTVADFSTRERGWSSTHLRDVPERPGPRRRVGRGYGSQALNALNPERA